MIRLSRKDLVLPNNKMDREIDEFLQITGVSNWKKNSKKLEQLMKWGQHYRVAICRLRNPLLDPVQRFLNLKMEGKTAWRNPDDELIYLAAKAREFNVIHYHTSESNGKQQLVGRLRSDSGVKPLLLEISTAIGLWQSGCAVGLTEYSRKDDHESTHDFNVSTSKREYEIECKWIAADTGRSFRDDNMADFMSAIRKEFENVKGSYRALIEIEEGVNTSSLDPNEVAKNLSLLAGGTGPSRKADEKYFVELLPLPIQLNSRDRNELKASIKTLWDPRYHIASAPTQDSGTVVVNMGHKNPRTKGNRIYDSAKDATKQFTRTLPAIVLIQVEALFHEDLVSTTGRKVVFDIAQRIFDSESRSHVCALGVLSEAILYEELNSKRMGGSVLWYLNENENRKFELSKEDVGELFSGK